MTIEEAITTICENYNYRLEDFYYKSFKEGGLTFGQLSVLYKHYEKRLVQRMEFDAGIVGAKLDKDKPAKREEQEMLFKSPEEYEKLSKKERVELTKEMKEHWQLQSFGVLPHGR